MASSDKVDTPLKIAYQKKPQMTQRYTHLRDEALKNASDLAGEIIGETMKAIGDKNKIERKGKK
jgi:hypothetical protein